MLLGFPHDDGRGTQQGYCAVKKFPVGRQLTASYVTRSSLAGLQAPVRRCLGDVNVSNDVTLSDVQTTVTPWCTYQTGSLLLMCRVQLFLLDVSELPILILMCSLLVATIE